MGQSVFMMSWNDPIPDLFRDVPIGRYSTDELVTLARHFVENCNNDELISEHDSPCEVCAILVKVISLHERRWDDILVKQTPHILHEDKYRSHFREIRKLKQYIFSSTHVTIHRFWNIQRSEIGSFKVMMMLLELLKHYERVTRMLDS